MDTELEEELKNIMDTKLILYGFVITEYNSEDKELKFQKYCYASSIEEAEQISFDYASNFQYKAPDNYDSEEKTWIIYNESGGITWEISVPEQLTYISIPVINGDTIKIYL